MGMLLSSAGSLIMLVGSIMFLVAAFGESLMWGIGSLCLPPVGLVFIVLHWDKAKKAFLVQLLGAVLATVGKLLTGP